MPCWFAWMNAEERAHVPRCIAHILCKHGTRSPQFQIWWPRCWSCPCVGLSTRPCVDFMHSAIFAHKNVHYNGICLSTPSRFILPFKLSALCGVCFSGALDPGGLDLRDFIFEHPITFTGGRWWKRSFRSVFEHMLHGGIPVVVYLHDIDHNNEKCVAFCRRLCAIEILLSVCVSTIGVVRDVGVFSIRATNHTNTLAHWMPAPKFSPRKKGGITARRAPKCDAPNAAPHTQHTHNKIDCHKTPPYRSHGIVVACAVVSTQTHKTSRHKDTPRVGNIITTLSNTHVFGHLPILKLFLWLDPIYVLCRWKYPSYFLLICPNMPFFA